MVRGGAVVIGGWWLVVTMAVAVAAGTPWEGQRLLKRERPHV